MATTDTCEKIKCAADNAAKSRWAPWVIAVVAIVVLIAADSLVHMAQYGHTSFVQALQSTGANELFMRGLIVILVLCIATLWDASVRSHNARCARVEAARNQLETLSTDLAHGRSEAHRTLAYRLHDDVAQALSAARMFLTSAIDDETPVDPAVARSVTRILDRAMSDCRDIAQELSPPALDEYGLLPALEALGNRIAVRAGVSVEVPAEFDLDLDRPMMLAAYDALSEYLSSAAANPLTRTIRVSAESTDSHARIHVQWDAEDHDEPMHTSQRLALFGVAVSRCVEQGSTLVTISAPLRPAA